MNSQISVCMATYNGKLYIVEQIQSIRSQLGVDDQLVVVDDGSRDDTIDLIAEIDDPRIILHRQDNHGAVKAFEYAIESAAHDLIVLADQDDIWPPGRLELLRTALQHSPMIAGSLETFGGSESRRISFRSTSPSRLSALVDLIFGRAPYFGSAMAFDRSQLPDLLPFPDWIEAHDHWIAVNGIVAARPQHVDSIVTFRREHGTNLTPRIRRNLHAVIQTRMTMVRMILLVGSRRVASGSHRDLR